MRELTRSRIRIFLWVLAAGTLVGIGYGSLIGYAGWGAPFQGGLIGAVHGFAIAGGIHPIELFGTRTSAGRTPVGDGRQGRPPASRIGGCLPLSGGEGYHFTSLKQPSVRGRSAPVDVFSVEKVD